MQKQNKQPCSEIENIAPSVSDETFRKKVKPCLVKNSESHCSYCDEHFFNQGILEVEHFKSKTKFPDLEREYSNLYASCNACNKRKRDENYPKNGTLRPDHENYRFDKYFFFEPDSGKIETLQTNTLAENTIDFLNLNNSDLQAARRMFCYQWYKKGKRPSGSYRFINL